MLPHPAMKVILEEYLISVQLASERIARLRSSNERFVRQVATGVGGARAYGHERLPERSGDDRGERTRSAG